jgi:hypothetical protein
LLILPAEKSRYKDADNNPLVKFVAGVKSIICWYIRIRPDAILIKKEEKIVCTVKGLLQRDPGDKTDCAWLFGQTNGKITNLN